MSIISIILLCSLFSACGFIVAMLIFQNDANHDYEEDFDNTCNKTRHLYPIKEKGVVVLYCFCRNTVMRLSEEKNYVIVKL